MPKYTKVLHTQMPAYTWYPGSVEYFVYQYGVGFSCMYVADRCIFTSTKYYSTVPGQMLDIDVKIDADPIVYRPKQTLSGSDTDTINYMRGGNTEIKGTVLPRSARVSFV